MALWVSCLYLPMFYCPFPPNPQPGEFPRRWSAAWCVLQISRLTATRPSGVPAPHPVISKLMRHLYRISDVSSSAREREREAWFEKGMCHPNHVILGTRSCFGKRGA